MSLKDLTPEQRDLIAGGLMAVSENLNKAREQGNAQVDQYFNAKLWKIRYHLRFLI